MIEKPPPRPNPWARPFTLWIYIEQLEHQLAQKPEVCPCLYVGTQSETINQLVAENRNLRESCEILKALDAQKNRIIIDLGGEVP